MREELRNAKRREREAEKAKREMVGELSHDLKTPVATIRATCEVMDLKSRMKLKALERELQKIQTRMEQSEELEGNERLAEVEGNIRELQENIEKIGYITKKADTINQLVGNGHSCILSGDGKPADSKWREGSIYSDHDPR